jgi:hypothetical protein
MFYYGNKYNVLLDFFEIFVKDFERSYGNYKARREIQGAGS